MTNLIPANCSRSRPGKPTSSEGRRVFAHAAETDDPVKVRRRAAVVIPSGRPAGASSPAQWSIASAVLPLGRGTEWSPPSHRKLGSLDATIGERLPGHRHAHARENGSSVGAVSPVTTGVPRRPSHSGGMPRRRRGMLMHSGVLLTLNTAGVAGDPAGLKDGPGQQPYYSGLDHPVEKR